MKRHFVVTVKRHLVNVIFLQLSLKCRLGFSCQDKHTFNPLSAKPTKFSNTLKQFVGNLPTNCLSVFDHFVKLALKGLHILRTKRAFRMKKQAFFIIFKGLSTFLEGEIRTLKKRDKLNKWMHVERKNVFLLSLSFNSHLKLTNMWNGFFLISKKNKKIPLCFWK